jgi:hypothetical protein
MSIPHIISNLEACSKIDNRGKKKKEAILKRTPSAGLTSQQKPGFPISYRSA